MAYSHSDYICENDELNDEHKPVIIHKPRRKKFELPTDTNTPSKSPREPRGGVLSVHEELPRIVDDIHHLEAPQTHSDVDSDDTGANQ